MGTQMEDEIKPRIETAQELVKEITRIGGLEHRRSGRRDSDGNEQASARIEGANQQPQDDTSHIPLYNSLQGRLLEVVVTEARVKDDLVDRLHEVKLNLIDLCERQLADLVENPLVGSQADIEDVDKLLTEMRTVRRSMETIVSIELALRDT